jgi:hypothetical protein
MLLDIKFILSTQTVRCQAFIGVIWLKNTISRPAAHEQFNKVQRFVHVAVTESCCATQHMSSLSTLALVTPSLHVRPYLLEHTPDKACTVLISFLGLTIRARVAFEVPTDFILASRPPALRIQN